MAKGDDAVARKKNKSRRKKMDNDTSSSAVSVRVVLLPSLPPKNAGSPGSAASVSGKDILERSGSSCTIEQIAWMVSIAADSITSKEKGLSFTSPFLLFQFFLCHPRERPYSLKSCEPEFLVSTPERLLELVSLKAINISDVSFLVVDGARVSFQRWKHRGCTFNQETDFCKLSCCGVR
ncbi:unnamed protein product [Linum tenue]|uniref:Uncharacterized protein n=1 Tax=Linum tenue TaxID=586396 RepID=A0AAV0M8X0_9ROSI|nr:unnamed protein product [Linum tenue]